MGSGLAGESRFQYMTGRADLSFTAGRQFLMISDALYCSRYFNTRSVIWTNILSSLSCRSVQTVTVQTPSKFEVFFAALSRKTRVLTTDPPEGRQGRKKGAASAFALLQIQKNECGECRGEWLRTCPNQLSGMRIRCKMIERSLIKRSHGRRFYAAWKTHYADIIQPGKDSLYK